LFAATLWVRLLLLLLLCNQLLLTWFCGQGEAISFCSMFVALRIATLLLLHVLMLLVLMLAEYCGRGEAISFWRVLSRAQSVGDVLVRRCTLHRMQDVQQLRHCSASVLV
jgi:hypothetical protein